MFKVISFSALQCFLVVHMFCGPAVLLSLFIAVNLMGEERCGTLESNEGEVSMVICSVLFSLTSTD